MPLETCPADVVSPAGTECRAATGTCDVAEACSGAGTIKIGVLNDQSGPYRDTGGVSSVAAVQMAVDEFAARARKWLAENMPSIDPDDPPDADRGEEGPWLDRKSVV